MKTAGWNLFRLRNLVGAALVLGILVGVWLGDWFKGFGLGPGEGGSQSAKLLSTKGKPGESDRATADLVGFHADDDASDASEPKPAGLVKVLIDDRSYYLREGAKKTPIALEELVRLIEQTSPNEDGLKAVIERTATSRVSTEIKLFDALKEAGVAENSIYLAPQAVE